jgi:hypothetical protein
MRWIGVPCALVVVVVITAVAGCGFSAPRVAPSADAGGDAPGMDAPSDGLPPDGPPASAAHTRRIDITDALVAGGPHTDFPLLVSLTAPWLRTTTAGGDVESASGFDIGFFADAAGTLRLAHEVEAYRGDTGALIAWVKLPSLAPSSELFLRYGNPAITTSQESVAAVWSNLFAAVWHLSSDLTDSTASANDGTNTGAGSSGGQIGDARDFNGMSDHIDVGSGDSIDDIFAGGGTVEAWFRASTWGEGGRGRIFEKGETSGGNDFSGWTLGVDNVNMTGSILFGHGSTSGMGGGWNSSFNSVSLNTWTHVAVVYDQGSTSSNPTFYLNGMPTAAFETFSPGGAIESDGAYGGQLGNRGAGDRTFDGRLDEVRLSTTARSPDWIATSFRNQSNPAGFAIAGPEL